MKEAKVLNYKGIIIRRSDTEILRCSCYLNDRLIEFYFRYLSSICGTEDILLVSPSVSFCLANATDLGSLKELVEPLSFEERKLVFFAVNDNNDVSVDEDEAHWSLLVYYRTMHTFVHHDSLGGINNWHARRLYEAVKGFMGNGGSANLVRKSARRRNREHKKRIKTSMAQGPADACFTEIFTPQQSNGYDCALYVMMIADVICEWYLARFNTKSLFWLSALEKRVTDSYVELRMRAHLLQLIDTLKDEDYDSSG
ncbi:hypothetical protein Ancab_001900 [Ancistrocladus abbreviatus]